MRGELFPPGPGPRVLLIDNYDSFTYNLWQYLAELGARVRVEKNDALDLPRVAALDPTHVVLSPGPGTVDRPRDFGVGLALIGALTELPILGVCLGHQGIARALGARVIRAPRPLHGKTSRVRRRGGRLFAGLPEELAVMRYHSLVVDEGSLPAELSAVAWALDDGCVMALEHHTRPLFGIQFHPESIGTPCGHALLQAFLREGRARGGVEFSRDER